MVIYFVIFKEYKLLYNNYGFIILIDVKSIFWKKYIGSW